MFAVPVLFRLAEVMGMRWCAEFVLIELQVTTPPSQQATTIPLAPVLVGRNCTHVSRPARD